MKRPALIAHVIYRLDVGGLENGLVNLVNFLPEERFRHAIICLAGYSDFRQRIRRPNVRVTSLDKQPGKDPAAYWRMHRLLRELRPQILHTRNIGTVDMQWVGAAAAVPGRIHGEHGWTADDPHGQSRHNLRIRRACRPAIHRWIAMSRDIEGWLHREVGVPQSVVRQLYNGVDTERFSPVGGRAADTPWADDAGAVTIGTVGRLDPVKNQAWLLGAFHRILERHPELGSRLRLIIAGDGPLRVELAESVRQLGIGGQVWLAGARSDVPELMRTMDVFVLPSRNEGISNTILEAMACGKPVVAARVGGNPEIVASGHTGILHACDDEGAFESALLAYLDNPAMRMDHGRAGRDRAVSEFSIDAMVRRYTDCYDELLATRN